MAPDPARRTEPGSIRTLPNHPKTGIREAGGDHGDDALDDVDRVRDELHRRTPDRGRIIQLLERITAVVTPVSGLLEVADHARELISFIPH